MSRRRSPPPQGGERASSAVSLVSPPPALPPSASYVVSHWLSGASGCPGKDTKICMMYSNCGAFKYVALVRREKKETWS